MKIRVWKPNDIITCSFQISRRGEIVQAQNLYDVGETRQETEATTGRAQGRTNETKTKADDSLFLRLQALMKWGKGCGEDLGRAGAQEEEMHNAWAFYRNVIVEHWIHTDFQLNVVFIKATCETKHTGATWSDHTKK